MVFSTKNSSATTWPVTVLLCDVTHVQIFGLVLSDPKGERRFSTPARKSFKRNVHLYVTNFKEVLTDGEIL
jgi:hypothetical protein